MEISNDELKARAQNIEYFFADVDGTLTDGCVYYDSKGESLKKFSLRDGSGFFLLQQVGIKTGIITGENSSIVESRAKKLKVNKLIMGAVPKVKTLGDFLSEEGLSFSNVAYIGDSINDIKLFELVGLSFAVSDADEYCLRNAHIECKSKGGNGAFLEAVKILLKLKGLDLDGIIEKSL